MARVSAKAGRGFAFFAVGTAGAVGAIAARVLFFPRVSDDFVYFFDRWIEIVRSLGARSWNPSGFANYTPPSFYVLWSALRLEKVLGFDPSNLEVLKTATLSGDFLLGLSAFALARSSGGSKRISSAAALAVGLTPTLLLNSAWWGQFDAWYSAFLLFSVAALLRERIPESAFFFASAFVWKAQSLFVLPALGPLGVLVILRNRKGSVSGVGSGAAMAGAAALFGYLAWILPAHSVGFGWGEVFSIYSGQSDTFHRLSMNAPSVWSLFPEADYGRWSAFGIGLGLAASLSIAVSIFGRGNRRWSRAGSLDWILLSAILIPLVLPQMHERYFFAAEAVATVNLVLRRDARSAAVWILLEIVGLRTYAEYLFGWGSPPFPVLVPMVVASAAIVAISIRGDPAKEE